MFITRGQHSVGRDKVYNIDVQKWGYVGDRSPDLFLFRMWIIENLWFHTVLMDICLDGNLQSSVFSCENPDGNFELRIQCEHIHCLRRFRP